MKKMLLSICFVFLSAHLSFAADNVENLIDSLAGSKNEAIEAYHKLSRIDIKSISALINHIHDDRTTNIYPVDIGESVLYQGPKITVGNWCYRILINMIDRHESDPPKFYGYFYYRYDKDLLLRFLEQNKSSSLEELQLMAAKEAEDYYKYFLEVYQNRIKALDSKKLNH